MMTSLKMQCLLPLAVLLLLSIASTVAEVVKLMSECKGFLLNDTPPNIPRIILDKIQIQNKHKIICQTYENMRSFVTLYDTENKIPVFSAYKYRREDHSEEETGRHEIPLKIEPQLEDMKNDINMKDCNNSADYEHQASSKDYQNITGYNRVHLFPYSHAFNETVKKSTFTLTNIVPKAQTFSRDSWNKMQTYVKCILQKHCSNNGGYIVTGAVPSNNNKLKNKINIPSELWSAFCCLSDKPENWLAGAYWGNDSDSTVLQMKTLAELSEELHIEVFQETHCPHNETVIDYYSKTNKIYACSASSNSINKRGTASTTATLITIIPTTIVLYIIILYV